MHLSHVATSVMQDQIGNKCDVHLFETWACLGGSDRPFKLGTHFETKDGHTVIKDGDGYLVPKTKQRLTSVK